MVFADFDIFVILSSLSSGTATIPIFGSMVQKGKFSACACFDAVKALDIGIQGERQVAEGLINVQFIQDVVNILVEEIEDPDLIKKIAAKLKVLMASKDNE